MQRRRTLLYNLIYIAVNRDLVQFGDVTERYGLAEKAEDVSPSWATEWSVGVIGGTVVPASKALWGGWCSKSWWVVYVT